MPTGTQVHNIELTPGKGGQMVRSAGVSAPSSWRRRASYALLRLPSGEMRRVRDRVRRHSRPGRQRRAFAGEARQGRAYAPPRPPATGPRLRHEPPRPPARWWRRPRPGRACPARRRHGASRRSGTAPATTSAPTSSSPAGERSRSSRCHVQRRRAPTSLPSLEQAGRGDAQRPAAGPSSRPGRALRRSCRT